MERSGPETDEGGGAGDGLLSLPTDTVCYIIAKAREFDVKTGSSDPAASELDEENTPAAVLEDRPSDPVEQELADIISDLSDDGRIDLVTLMWLGRGDHDETDWDELRRIAAQERTARTAAYLCGTPLLGDHLSAGLELLGLDCTEFLAGHG